MARTGRRPAADREQVLETVHPHCPACGARLRYRYDNRHTVNHAAAEPETFGAIHEEMDRAH